MRAEQHRDPELLLKFANDLDNIPVDVSDPDLAWGSSRNNSLGLPEQRLRKEEALALAARQFGKRSARELGCPNHIQGPLDVLSLGGTELGNSPPLSAGGARHKIPSCEAEAGETGAGLGHVTDFAISPRGAVAQNSDCSGFDRDQTQCSAHQRCLAGPVRAKHGDELSLFNRERDGRKNVSAAKIDRNFVERKCAHISPPERAWSSASSCDVIHCW